MLAIGGHEPPVHLDSNLQAAEIWSQQTPFLYYLIVNNLPSRDKSSCINGLRNTTVIDVNLWQAHHQSSHQVNHQWACLKSNRFHKGHTSSTHMFLLIKDSAHHRQQANIQGYFYFLLPPNGEPQLRIMRNTVIFRRSNWPNHWSCAKLQHS